MSALGEELSEAEDRRLLILPFPISLRLLRVSDCIVRNLFLLNGTRGTR